MASFRQPPQSGSPPRLLAQRAAQRSETEADVTPQPTPDSGADINTSDILVETMIDWGATHVCHSACNIDPLSRGIGVQN